MTHLEACWLTKLQATQERAQEKKERKKGEDKFPGHSTAPKTRDRRQGLQFGFQPDTARGSAGALCLPFHSSKGVNRWKERCHTCKWVTAFYGVFLLPATALSYFAGRDEKPSKRPKGILYWEQSWEGCHYLQEESNKSTKSNKNTCLSGRTRLCASLLFGKEISLTSCVVTGQELRRNLPTRLGWQQ